MQKVTRLSSESSSVSQEHVQYGKEYKIFMIHVTSVDLRYVYSQATAAFMLEDIGTSADPASTRLGTGTVNDRAISSCQELLGQGQNIVNISDRRAEEKKENS